MPNKRKINFETVQFTPVSGSVVTISHVQSIDNPENGQRIEGRGDNTVYATHKRVIGSDPVFDMKFQDHAAYQSLGIGTKGSFTFIIKDADGIPGTLGSGDITVLASNSVIVDKSRSLQYAQHASLAMKIETWSTDGITPPVAYS